MTILFSLFLEVGMDKRLIFYSILDFYPRKDDIKAIYKSLSFDDKTYYKKYVYSLCFEKEGVKDLMWEYLNDWEESYERLGYEYSLKRRKLKNDNIENNTDTYYFDVIDN